MVKSVWVKTTVNDLREVVYTSIDGTIVSQIRFIRLCCQCNIDEPDKQTTVYFDIGIRSESVYTFESYSIDMIDALDVILD